MISSFSSILVTYPFCDLQHYYYMIALFDHVRDVGVVIHQQSAMIDDFQAKVERMEKREVSFVVAKVEAHATKLMHQPEDAKQCHICVMEDELLRFTRELDIVKAHSLGLIEEVVAAIERA